jgi:hypothetical protein
LLLRFLGHIDVSVNLGGGFSFFFFFNGLQRRNKCVFLLCFNFVDVILGLVDEVALILEFLFSLK